MKLNDHIRIERDDNGDYLITWTDCFSQSPVDIYASTSPSDPEKGEKVHRSNGRWARIDNLREPQRHYFHLVPHDGNGVTMAERRLPLHSSTNLRDFGGYLTEDGRQVLWGKLYRSGHLSLLDETDQAYLANLGIRKNCDFRRQDERTKEPNKLPSETETIGLSVDAGGFGSFFETLTEAQLNREYMIEVMRDINREMVRDYQHRFRDMFTQLLALEEGAFLVNCTAGKDRTGFAVALILAALGVPRETILYDYMLSGRYFQADRERARAQEKYGPEVVKVMFNDAVMAIAEAREEYLSAAFNAIETEYGSMEQFLEEAYGVGADERQSLRQRLTL